MLIAFATGILILISPLVLYIALEFVEWKKHPGSHRFYKPVGKHHEKNRMDQRRRTVR